MKLFLSILAMGCLLPPVMASEQDLPPIPDDFKARYTKVLKKMVVAARSGPVVKSEQEQDRDRIFRSDFSGIATNSKDLLDNFSTIVEYGFRQEGSDDYRYALTRFRKDYFIPLHNAALSAIQSEELLAKKYKNDIASLEASEANTIKLYSICKEYGEIHQDDSDDLFLSDEGSDNSD